MHVITNKSSVRDIVTVVYFYPSKLMNVQLKEAAINIHVYTYRTISIQIFQYTPLCIIAGYYSQNYLQCSLDYNYTTYSLEAIDCHTTYYTPIVCVHKPTCACLK